MLTVEFSVKTSTQRETTYMKHWTSFIAHSMVSRILIDKAEIPYEHYAAIKPHIEELQSWASVFQELKVNEPNTWVSTGQRLISRITSNSRGMDLEQKRMSHQDMWESAMNHIGFTEVNHSWFLYDLIAKAVSTCSTTEIFRDDDHTYHIVHISDSCKVYLKKYRPKTVDLDDGKEIKVSDGRSQKGSFNGKMYLGGVLYVPNASPNEFAAFLKQVGELLYDDCNLYSLEYSAKKGDLLVKPFAFPEREYQGDALSLIPEWKLFMEKGIRRCVCLHGAPGTGKSTLARTAVKEINRRTLRVSQKAFYRANFTSWTQILALINPEILILDDIDRIRDLEEYLDRFEDSYYKVPLTIFTSNDLKRLPDAFKRPGRIDQIIELEDPNPEVQLAVLRSFLKMEGLEGEIPLHRIPFMAELYRLYSGAYAVEYVRRIVVFGWDYILPKGDITFHHMVGKEDKLDPRKHPEVGGECLLYQQALAELNRSQPSVSALSTLSNELHVEN